LISYTVQSESCALNTTTMVDFFKQSMDKPQDVKAIRDALLHFIKDRLRKVEGGEGANIKGLHLFVACSEEDRHMYEAALYSEDPERFKEEEVQRIADDFAIELPANWTMGITFVDSLPPEVVRIPNTDAGLFIQTRSQVIEKEATAYIYVLNGEAEKEAYTINSKDGSINIGREKKTQGVDGFFRINHIAFPSESQDPSNKYISRQHAHIEFDNDSGQFLLFADEGGVPPRNKIKVRSRQESTPIKIFSTRIGHALQEGDQIMLGESAIVEFSYSNKGK
jgi:pSer/pThr/pTyr-binding forkhead associated (FHA) protein